MSRNVTEIKGRAQLTLDFEPTIAERFSTLRDFIRYRVDGAAKPIKSIAGDMDLSPSLLSRKLSPHEGDTQRLNCDDLERYITATGDTAPIEYLAAKFMQAPEARQAHAIARVEALAAELERTLSVLKGAA
jgi:hypothetical protein